MKKIFISLIISASPLAAFAANGVNTSYLDSVISATTRILNSIVVIILGLAVVWFIWNVIKYAMSEEDEGKTKAKDQMINGIIAIAVCVSIWGIVALLRSAFGVDGASGAPKNLDSLVPNSLPSAEQSPYFVGPTQN